VRRLRGYSTWFRLAWRIPQLDRQVLNLIVNGGGIIAKSLISRLEESSHEVHALGSPGARCGAAGFKDHFERIAQSGQHYDNVFIDLSSGFSEIDAFNTDTSVAIADLECRVNEMLSVLKYGAQHMARSEGGRIWVLCLDHSVSMSVSSASNPVTNYAAMAAVQCLAKEVLHFGVLVNLFLIHPPRESIDAAEWRKAKINLHPYALKYKPQPVEHLCETLQMYAELKNLTTSGALIPVGSGISTANI
jgi:hypothetical protein